MFTRCFLVCLLALALASCEKKEDALVLPPHGAATDFTIAMGENYDKQVFFDFETNTAVLSSDPSSWDLAFETGTAGRHVFINGGQKEFVYNTHDTVMDKVITLPASLTGSGSGWQYDAPCGLPDSTGMGNWFNNDGSSKKEVYIVQTGAGDLKKLRVLGGDKAGYDIEWAALQDVGKSSTLHIAKDSSYNRAYFSFSNGAVNPDPPKDTWDIVFTRYCYVYHNYPSAGLNFPYEVTGVLLNPTNTICSADSTTPFASIDLQLALSLATTDFRDIIGFDWKGYGLGTTGLYTVNRAKNYVVHTRKGQIYKMHFLDFYNSSGVKGYPHFEYQRLK